MLLTELDKLIPPGPPPKVKTRLIATLLPAIEAVITRGFTHVQVHALLVERGIAMEFKYYEDVIYMLRRKRASVAATAEASPASFTAPPQGNGLARPGQQLAQDQAFTGPQKRAELSAAIGSVTPSGSNISKAGTSDGKDKFHPRNSRNFNIKDI